MTVQDLIIWCLKNNVSLDTPIALREKDDFLLVKENIRIDVPYFGNCPNGDDYLKEIMEVNEDGEIDYDNTPGFLIFDTGN